MWFLEHATTNDQKCKCWLMLFANRLLCYVIWLQTIILFASKQVVKKSKSNAAAKLRGTEETVDVGVS